MKEIIYDTLDKIKTEILPIIKKKPEITTPPNLFLISYDKHFAKADDKIIRKRVLVFIELNEGTVLKEPVETTILFSSKEPYKHWFDLANDSNKSSKYIKGLYKVLVQVIPPHLDELHLKGDPKLRSGLTKEIKEVRKMIKENTVDAIEKLLLLPVSHTPQSK